MEMDVLSMTTKSSFAVKGARMSFVARLYVCSYFDLCIIIIHTYLASIVVWLARPCPFFVRRSGLRDQASRAHLANMQACSYRIKETKKLQLLMHTS